MPQTLSRCFSALALVLSASSLKLPAQTGPGIPSLTYPANEVFTVISTVGSGSHGVAMMLDGYLGLLQTGSGLSLYDISNPYLPVQHGATQAMGLSEPHTYAQTTAFGGRHLVVIRGPAAGGNSIGIWDLTNSAQPALTVNYQVPGVPGGYATGLFWMFAQGNVIYCPAGSLGLFIVDASSPSAPVVAAQIPKSALGGFNTVLAYAIGNMLVLANSDGGAGFALLDIGDPFNPVLIHSNPATSIPYSGQVNGGQFIVAAVSNCISCTGGNNGSFHSYDIGSAAFSAASSAGLPSRGGSVAIQDKYVHVAASSNYVKLIPARPNAIVVGTTANPTSGGDIDWVTPIGNLVALGDDQNGATKLVPHQSHADTFGPSVTMVVPADNAIQQMVTSRIGITMADMVDLDSLDSTTFFVRPVGGQAIAGSYSVQIGIVNFSPAAPLLPNTTYEVLVPAGGVRDWAGNGTPHTFRSVFSTGPTINVLQVGARPTAPVVVGQSASFAVTSASGPGSLTYSWNFGDGSPATVFSSSSAASHSYTQPGHYSVQVTVTNGGVIASAAVLQTVHNVVSSIRPTHSSTIVLHPATGWIWCVNSDNDTVTAIDPLSNQKLLEVPVGNHPRTLATAPDGTVWVVNEGDATISVLHATSGALQATIALPLGSAPYGIAMSPDGLAAYVTLRRSGEVARLNPTTRTLNATVAVGPEPKGLAITSDSVRLLVTRFVSGTDAEVFQLTSNPFAANGAVTLAFDAGPDTDNSGRGIPNYLNSATISPDGRRAWLPSKKDNIARGMFRDGQALTFENTVRTIVSQIDLLTSQEVLSDRIDFNDRDMAFAVEFSPLGDYAFTALQGSNAIDVRDAYNGELVAGVDGTGLAPQGMVLSNDGQRLFVHNFMSRTVAVYDVSGVTQSTTFAFQSLANINTVATEQLAADVLLGKQIFYNAADPRMNEDGYLSCASCHLDGGSDGRVWDFTDRGEGLRNTTSLHGRAGIGHGRVHWTANFDEIQDFENDIRNNFGGDGFLTQAQWQTGTVSNPLGQPKAGLSPDLDALAAYVASLSTFGRSPYRQANGLLSAAADRGQTLFANLGCATCHSGPGFTDSMFAVIHNVGTIKAGSGQAMGGPLLGLDTPTLRGLWATAPYLHDGSAATLMDVLVAQNTQGLHGASNALTQAEQQDLVAYLLSIDDEDAACRLPGTEEDLELLSGIGPVANANCLEEAFAGQTVRHIADSPGGTFHGSVAAIIYQLHTPGLPPLPVLPGLQLDHADDVQLAVSLQVSGFVVDTPIPAGLAGTILRSQVIVLSPLTGNGIYATSLAHDVYLR